MGYLIAGSANEDTVGIVEKTDTATHNISKGQYVIWKGAPCVASSAISSGNTLSSSNLTSITTGVINSLLSRVQSLEEKVDAFHYTQITSNQNLNNFKENGFFGCPNGTVASSLSNCPVNSGFGLLVVEKSSAYVQQIILISGTIWVRGSTSSGWGAWTSVTS